MSKKKTTATMANIPRSRCRFTRRQRKEEYIKYLMLWPIMKPSFPSKDVFDGKIKIEDYLVAIDKMIPPFRVWLKYIRN